VAPLARGPAPTRFDHEAEVPKVWVSYFTSNVTVSFEFGAGWVIEKPRPFRITPVPVLVPLPIEVSGLMLSKSS
jgi:hypothetical protein